MIRVFLADDHAVVRAGLERIILAAGDMTVVGTAKDGRQVLQAAEAGAAWDVLVLDLSLPRVSGIEVLRRLRSLRPSLPILILSMYSEEHYAIRLMREGAAAYLSKERPPEDLIAAVRRLASGEIYLTASQAAQIVQVPGEAERPPHHRLSAREHQIFVLIVNGRTVSAIAAELDLSVSTVSTHLAHIKEKLGAQSIADIVSYAHRMGLIGQGPGPGP